jgi:hypothetical protein
MAALAINFGGTGLNLIMGLLAAHDKRMQEAKVENQASNLASGAQTSDMKTITDAYNKGDVTVAVAITAVQTVKAWYWQYMGPYMQQPGIGLSGCPPVPNGVTGSTPTQHIKCAGNCRITCCLGCNFYEYEWAAMVNALSALSAASVKAGTKKIVTFGAIAASKYGYTGRPAFSVTLIKPTVINKEAEVTIDKKTGIVSVGAPPSPDDAVIATGVEAAGAAPDTGGDVIQHNASGEDVNVVNAPGSLQSTSGILLIAGAVFVAILAVVAVQK